MDLRVFLTYGMVGSGVFVCLFGLGQYWNIHNLYYYVFVQVCAGVFQSTGWPSVVSVMGNWFGKSKRGLIMVCLGRFPNPASLFAHTRLTLSFTTTGRVERAHQRG